MISAPAMIGTNSRWTAQSMPVLIEIFASSGADSWSKPARSSPKTLDRVMNKSLVDPIGPIQFSLDLIGAAGLTIGHLVRPQTLASAPVA